MNKDEFIKAFRMGFIEGFYDVSEINFNKIDQAAEKAYKVRLRQIAEADKNMREIERLYYDTKK